MDSAQIPSTDAPAAKGPSQAGHARFFYTGAAALLLVLMVLGFQHFYLHGQAYPGRQLAPPNRSLLIVHGVAMTAWMLLFLVQPLLIATGKRRPHFWLGKIGAVLAALIVFLGLRVGIESARVNPPDLLLWGLSPRQFLAVPVLSILMFGVFVALGVWKRERPEVHRPMMLLSAFVIMAASLDRIGPLRELYADTIWGTLFGPFFSVLVIGVLLLILNRVLTRRWDRWLALGCGAFALAGALIVQLAPTRAWASVADFLLR